MNRAHGIPYDCILIGVTVKIIRVRELDCGLSNAE